MEISTDFYKIGAQHPCYIIAEIGSNHNGNFDQAIEMIEKANQAGVNAVKFQTFKAANHYSKKTPKISLYKEDIYDLIESLEIDRSWHSKLSKHCKSLGIDFLDSPCDFEAIDLAISIGMPLMKVASFDMVDLKLIEKIAKSNKGIIFSTGMANLSEIQNAINVCRAQDNHNIVVLQCTSLYPAPIGLSNLKAMNSLKECFNVLVGYSDHTLGDHIACAAVARGACVVEKHFTLNRSMEGPDHQFAIEPKELKEMVSKIRDIEQAIGDGEKNGPRPEELEMYKMARRSLIAASTIKAGSIIQSEDIAIKRPGLGIHPHLIDVVIGRRATKDIEKDEPILWQSI